MPVEHDPFTQIVNVHWEEEAEGFLYSGADGMYGSRDGIDWVKNNKGIAAATLAFVDDVWVAFDRSGQAWRSIDGATTWKSTSAPALIQVVAMKPKSTDPNKPMPGVFAGWKFDDDDNGQIYVSKDLGQSWSLAKTITRAWVSGTIEVEGAPIELNGYEIVNGISGCGGALFVCTIWGNSQYHNGDGKIYSSTTGDSFLEQKVFGPGTENFPPFSGLETSEGFNAAAVGYDPETKIYMAIAHRQYGPEPGAIINEMVYSKSSSSAFGESKGTTIISQRAYPTINTGPVAAGGDGVHIGAFNRFEYTAGGEFVSGNVNAVFIPGASQVLQSMNGFGGTVSSICFKSDSEESTEGSTDSTGKFACAAFGSDLNGGVYIARAGNPFTKTHSGKAFGTAPNLFRPYGEVAVGTVSFIETSTA